MGETPDKAVYTFNTLPLDLRDELPRIQAAPKSGLFKWLNAPNASFIVSDMGENVEENIQKALDISPNGITYLVDRTNSCVFAFTYHRGEQAIYVQTYLPPQYATQLLAGGDQIQSITAIRKRLETTDPENKIYPFSE
ncbi:MAG: hypothetical protein JNK26_04200 [Candidatus Doudnabacteria bacterium]|nr:hypothetical protein [Candidatus Doudnabacteria bacterium]